MNTRLKEVIQIKIPSISGLFSGSTKQSAIKALSKVVLDKYGSTELELINFLESDEFKPTSSIIEESFQDELFCLVTADAVRNTEVNTITRILTKFDNYNYYLATIIVIGFFLSLALTVYNKEIESNPVIMMLLGALVSNFNQVTSYFFGASISEKKITENK